MIFFVDGKDCATSSDVCVTLEGPDAAAVRSLAAQRGIAVISVEPAGGPPDPDTFTDKQIPPAAYPGGRPLSRYPSHSGRWPDLDAQFFAKPPSDIGSVRSADSTLLDGHEPLDRITRTIIIAVPSLIAAALLYLSIFGPATRIAPPSLAVASLLAAALSGLLAWLTRFRRHCTYVGERGVARFTTVAPPAVRRSEVVPFTRAAELRTMIHRHYAGRVCVATEYDFVFLDAARKPMLRIFGECRHAGEGPPSPHEGLLHFALAAEAAWTRHLTREALLTLRETGHVEFRISAADRIRLSRGRITFFISRREWTWTAAEIGEFIIADGSVRISHRDATTLRGHVRFPYARLSNAALFLQLLERLCQITARR